MEEIKIPLTPDSDNDGVPVDQDCNDNDASIYPGAGDDTVLPQVTLFDIPSITIIFGESLTANYNVTDNQALAQVELWRTNDSYGQPDSSNWVIVQTQVSGVGNIEQLSDNNPPAGTWWYGLHVLDGACNLATESTPILVTVIDEPSELLPPTGLSANYESINNLVRLSWQSTSNAISYNIYWGTEEGVTTGSEFGGNTSDMEFAHNGVELGWNYYYKIAAVYSTGESELSEEVSAFVFENPNQTEQKRTASDGAAGDYFGHSVSISGNHAIVGMIYDDNEKGVNAGSAYIFELINGTWTEVDKLIAIDGAYRDFFGISVSISGNRAIVGAQTQGDQDLGFWSGAIYIFELIDNTWTEVVKLKASDGESNAVFGTSVSISGDYAIVGAPSSVGSANLGKAYFFERIGGTWTEVAMRTASDGIVGDWLGWSVSISGDYAIVGSYVDDTNGINSGAAYIFEYMGGAWTEVAKLTASDGAATDFFGKSVAISGNFSIVGSDQDDDNGQNSGSAYIFGRSSGGWTEVDKVTASDGTYYEHFGSSVSISGEHALIGNEYFGNAYIFNRSGKTWIEVEKLTGGNNALGSPSPVSISGEHAVLGYTHDGDNGSDSGAAYFNEIY